MGLVTINPCRCEAPPPLVIARSVNDEAISSLVAPNSEQYQIPLTGALNPLF